MGFTPLAQWLGLGIALALAAGALAGCRRLSRPAFGVRGALSAFARRKFLWVVLGVWAFFCFLVWHSFRWEGGAVYSSQATYGDMSMHLSFLTSLANQGDFPPDYSLLPGTRLSYPFLSDSISASLYQLGAPLWFAYQLPMWAAGAQVLFGLYAFFSAMTESRAQAALAWVFFAFNGGFGFFYFLGGGVENFTRIFTAFYETPTNLVGENIRWVNVLVDMMLPQRATLFGWAVLFPALYLLCRAVYQGQRRCFFLVGLMAGALPMIHTHSFLALGLVCGVWLAAWLLGRLSWEVPAARAGKLLLAVGLGALALCKELFRDREDSPLFLAAAGAVLGLFLLWLGLLVGEAFRRRQAREALGGLFLSRGGAFLRLAPALAIWLLAELVVFQPNVYDNNKVLYPAYAFLCCAAARCACRGLGLLRSRRARAGAAAGVVAVASFSAVLTMGREAVARYQLFGTGAVELAQWVEANTDPGSVILTDTRHNNEIAALAGRNVVCGSPSYLYYHGLPYDRAQRDVGQMYAAPQESQVLLAQYQVRYILVSDFERGSYPVNQAALDALYPRVYDDGSRVLYQVTEQEDIP